jgi:hypothetical protein
MEIKIHKQIFNSIKDKNLSRLNELVLQDHPIDPEMMINYLFRSISCKNTEAFDYLLSKTNYISEYLIKRVFCTSKNQIYKNSILSRIKQFPENHPCLGYMYSSILAYMVRYKKLSDPLIYELIHYPSIDFSNQIKNKVYLSKFVHTYLTKINNKTKNILNKLLIFFTPFINKKIIDIETLLFVLLITEKYTILKWEKTIDLTKKVPLYYKIYTHGFYWDENDIDNEPDFNMEKLDQRLQDKEIQIGTLLRVKNISFEEEYSIPKEDQEMVDLLCTLYNVKNNPNDPKLLGYNTFKTFLTNFKNKFSVYKYLDYSTFVTDINEFMDKNLIKNI